MIDLRRDLIQVFLFEKADVRECFAQTVTARLEANKVPVLACRFGSVSIVLMIKVAQARHC